MSRRKRSSENRESYHTRPVLVKKLSYRHLSGNPPKRISVTGNPPEKLNMMERRSESESESDSE